jgi:hypothetical protein
MGEDYDFHAILYGDVSGNWTSHEAPPAAASTSVADGPLAGGDTVIAPSFAPDAATAATADVVDSAEATIYLAAAHRDGPAVEYVLGLQAADGILGLDLVLGYDPDVLSIESVTPAGIASAMGLASHDQQGTLRVAMYGTAPLAGTGEFIVVRVLPRGPLPAPAPFKLAATANEGGIPVLVGPDLEAPEPPAPVPIAPAGGRAAVGKAG